MAKEIDNLRQIASERSTLFSYAEKREKQHARIGRRLTAGNVSSIERAVKFGELRQRVFDTWHASSERAEELDQTFSQETEKVENQLVRLKELGLQDPAVYTVYLSYQSSLETIRNGQLAPTHTTERPSSDATAVSADLGNPGDEANEPAEDKDGEKQEKVKHRRIFPNGIEIEIPEGRTLEILDLVDQGVTSSGDLAFRVYGEDNPVNKNRIGATIGGQINKLIRGTGLRLRNTVSRSDLNRGVPSHYIYEAIVQEDAQPTELSTKFRDVSPDVFNRPTTIATSLTSRGVAGVAKVPSQPKTYEIVEVPYSPSKEEIRTPEEARIIRYVVSAFKKSRQIDFEKLQKALKSEDRFEVKVGQRRYKVYESEELKRKFEKGIKLLREENLIPQLRQNWSEDENELWQDVQSQIQKLAQGNFDDFVTKIKIALDTSQKNFYRTHGGRTLAYLEISSL